MKEKIKILRDKVVCMLTDLDHGISEEKHDSVFVSGIEITLTEALAMKHAFKIILNSDDIEILKNVIPMKLITANIFWREIQMDINDILKQQ